MENTIFISYETAWAGLGTYEELKDSFPDYLLVKEIYKSMESARLLAQSPATDEMGQSEDHNAC